MDFEMEVLFELEQLFLKLEKAAETSEILGQIFDLLVYLDQQFQLLGLNGLNRVVWQLESLLSRLRNGALSVQPALVSLFLKCIDKLSASISSESVISFVNYENCSAIVQYTDLIQELGEHFKENGIRSDQSFWDQMTEITINRLQDYPFRARP
jgi:chemotaxis protein histidine kinase CheA